MRKRQGEDQQNFLESLRVYVEGERRDLDWISECIHPLMPNIHGN